MRHSGQAPSGERDQMAATIERSPYPTDLTDAQWRLIEPWLSKRAWTGRPRTVDLREVVNAVLYLLRTGCQWRFLVPEFPPAAGGGGLYALSGWGRTRG